MSIYAIEALHRAQARDDQALTSARPDAAIRPDVTRCRPERSSGEIADARTTRLLDRTPGSQGAVRAGRAVACRWASPSSFQAWRPVPDLPRARATGSQRLGRRRQRVRRLPRRLRLAWSSATRTRRSSRRSSTRRAPARTSPRRPRPRCCSPRSCAGASALEQVRFANSGTEATMSAIRVARAATGRDAHREDRRLVPRPPRRGDVLRGARTRTSWAGAKRRRRTPMSTGIPPIMAELHARRAVQRPRGARRAARRARRRDRVPDPRAGDDEHRHLPARARLPRRACRTCCTGTARC